MSGAGAIGVGTAADGELLARLTAMASDAGDAGGSPFAAAVVLDGEIVSIEANRVRQTNDPTAHAEVAAIRSACASLGRRDLAGATLYSSCEPCMMCAGAILWAGIEDVVYAAGLQSAAAFGVDERFPPGSYVAALLPLRLRHEAATRGAETRNDERTESAQAAPEESTAPARLS